ncbi:hypothetical protein ACWDZ6_08010 [Streptomyces sp. NPDC002926]
MAELVRRLRFSADVGCHSFCLQESDDVDLPVPYPEESVFGQFLTSFPGRVDIFSAAHTHTAAVTAEVWDGRPPEEDGRGGASTVRPSSCRTAAKWRSGP